MRRLQTGLALGGLLALVLLVAFKWSSLPPTIPIHFGADGRANGYGSRIWLWFPVGMAILLYGALSAVKRAPHIYNLPASPGSAQRQGYEKAAAQMIGWLRVTLVWMFFGIAVLEIRGAEHRGRQVILWLLPAVLLSAAVPLTWFLWQTRSLRR